jgi:hypothetical protein
MIEVSFEGEIYIRCFSYSSVESQVNTFYNLKLKKKYIPYGLIGKDELINTYLSGGLMLSV